MSDTRVTQYLPAPRGWRAVWLSEQSKQVEVQAVAFFAVCDDGDGEGTYLLPVTCRDGLLTIMEASDEAPDLLLDPACKRKVARRLICEARENRAKMPPSRVAARDEGSKLR